MTTTLTPAERAEINRNNAKKSTGPRTNEGKAGVNFKVFGVGFGADGSIGSGSSDERVQRISLTLVPGHRVAKDHPEGLRELVFAPPGSVPGPIAVVGENRVGYEG